MQSDARAIENAAGPEPAMPGCQVCGKPIRVGGSGQRPSYCGRGCSSKAYRARRKAEADALLAAAVDGSREPTGDPSADHLARLGTLVERSAQDLARTLTRTDLDPIHAKVSLSMLVRATEDLVVAARNAVRVAGEKPAPTNLDASREPVSHAAVPPARPAEPAAAGPVQPPEPDAPGRPGEFTATKLTGPGGGAAPRLDDSRESSRSVPEPTADTARVDVPGRVSGRPGQFVDTKLTGAGAGVSPRLDDSREPSRSVPQPTLTNGSGYNSSSAFDIFRFPAQPAGATVPDSVGEAAVPDLDGSRVDSARSVRGTLATLKNPNRRGLGRPTELTALGELGPRWALSGWPEVTNLYVVLYQGRQVGWVEYGAAGVGQWLAFAQDAYLVDGESGEPLWHGTERLAAHTVKAAVDQGII